MLTKQAMYFVVLFPYVLSHIGFVLFVRFSDFNLIEAARFYLTVNMFILVPFIFIGIARGIEKVFEEDREREHVAFKATYLIKFFGYCIATVPAIISLYMCYAMSNDLFVRWLNFSLWVLAIVNTVVQVMHRTERVGEAVVDIIARTGNEKG